MHGAAARCSTCMWGPPLQATISQVEEVQRQTVAQYRGRWRALHMCLRTFGSILPSISIMFHRTPVHAH